MQRSIVLNIMNKIRSIMNEIRSNARQILEKSCKTYNSELSIKEYVEIEAENDPYFFSWLFDTEDIEDFGNNLNEEQKNAYNEFLETLQ